MNNERRNQDEIILNTAPTQESESDESHSSEQLLSDVELQQTKEHQHLVSHDHSGKLRTIGLIFTVSFLLFLGLSSIKRITYLKLVYSSVSDGVWGIDDLQNSSQERTLGIKLHPQHHENRPAKLITHSWTISSGYRSPDGVKKKVYLVNGQFPGPTIECRSGDQLIVYIKNELVSEGISIHWHGLHMRNANSVDGAVGVTQCPIPGGNRFTYDFEVGENQSGTFWWHAHSEVQRGDGIYGGLVVHKPKEEKSEVENVDYEQDVLLMIGDWYHRTGNEILEWYMSARGFGNEPVPDSLLVNGAGRFQCSMAVPARPVECKDLRPEDMQGILGAHITTRLRVVNMGSIAGFSLGISSGKLTPLSIDGDFHVEGQPSSSVGIIYPGQRTDVLFEPASSTDSSSVKLIINLDPENFRFPNFALRPNQSFPLIVAQNVNCIDNSTTNMDSSLFFDLSTSLGLPPKNPIPQEVNQTILLYTKTEKLSINANKPLGFVNRTSWSPQSSPPLPLISLPRAKWDKNQFIPHIPLPPNGVQWVDIILNNLDDGSHPFHLHGHDFYVLSSSQTDHGWGSYSPYENFGSSSLKPELNLRNPVRRDTVMVPSHGYVILRVGFDNPGIWMFHCHVLWHAAGGMAMGFQVGGEEGHEGIDEGAGGLCAGV